MRPQHIRTNNPGLRFFMQYWGKHCQMEAWHWAWAREHLSIIGYLEKGRGLFREGGRQKKILFVARGLLGRVHDDGDKRQISQIALPGMALFTTGHLHSHTPSLGDIVALRGKTYVLAIPYHAFLDYEEQEPHLQVLLSMLSNEELKEFEFSEPPTVKVIESNQIITEEKVRRIK